jgi:1,4-dihydroxy-2-naphthoate octaprenyltransferase
LFLPFIIIPIAIRHAFTIWNEEDKRNLNDHLEKTARFMAIFGILFALGIIL